MNRRDSLKTIFLSSVAAGIAFQGCAPENSEETVIKNDIPKQDSKHYGRTVKEKERDAKLYAEQFLNKHELTTIALFCDIILPSNAKFGSANDAGVPEFIDFIVKDMPNHQLPIRGGIMWVDNFCNKNFGVEFANCTQEQQIQLCDLIAYPEKTAPEHKQGEKFFTLLRNLTLTGYFTSKMGIEDLGYKGNTPNNWDGVPEDVLQKHGMAYEEEWLKKCVDASTRNEVAVWDEDGNLIS